MIVCAAVFYYLLRCVSVQSLIVEVCVYIQCHIVTAIVLSICSMQLFFDHESLISVGMVIVSEVC